MHMYKPSKQFLFSETECPNLQKAYRFSQLLDTGCQWHHKQQVTMDTSGYFTLKGTPLRSTQYVNTKQNFQAL